MCNSYHVYNNNYISMFIMHLVTIATNIGIFVMKITVITIIYLNLFKLSYLCNDFGKTV